MALLIDFQTSFFLEKLEKSQKRNVTYYLDVVDIKLVACGLIQYFSLQCCWVTRAKIIPLSTVGVVCMYMKLSYRWQTARRV